VGIFDRRNKSEEIYFDKDWADRRLSAERNYKWYSGAAVREMMSQTPSEETGQPVPLYPLGINLIEPLLEIHQALTVGSLPDYNTAPVEFRFRTDESDKSDAELLRKVFHTILKDSDIISKLTHAVMMSQVDGGMMWKVNWEPNSDFLKYRMRWLFYRSHLAMPVWNQYDPWRLEECYLGWEISAADAKKRYNVGVKDGKDQVVYLEHWTRTNYEITVDGKVPNNTEYGELSGEHGLGRVPFIYIPMKRGGDGFWGENHVDSMTGLQIEMNERMADIGDAVADITHPDMYVTDTRKNGGVKLTFVTDENHHTRPVWDLGDTSPLPGSRTPAMSYVQHANIPQDVMNHPDKLFQNAHWNAHVPMAATGYEQYPTGRITGVGTQAQMGGVLYHTQQERVNLAEGMRHLADVTMRMFQAHTSDYSQLDVKAPKITDKHFDYEVVTLWAPQLPMEEDAESQMINQDVTAGTTSLETALQRKHVPDVLEEKARIEKDMEFKNQLQIQLVQAQAEAKAAAQPPSQGA
jgi:hypothetical protein